MFADSPNGFRNQDSLGEQHEIRPGGLHWIRASRRIIHEEIPPDGGGPVRGLQIFFSLPVAHQGDDAAAFPRSPEAMIRKSANGWQSRTAIDGTGIAEARAAPPSPVRVQEVLINTRSDYEVALPAGWGGMSISLEGSNALPDALNLRAAEAIGVASSHGGAFKVSANYGAARIAIILGQQLHQDVHTTGPLMLASAETLASAPACVATFAIPTLPPVI